MNVLVLVCHDESDILAGILHDNVISTGVVREELSNVIDLATV